MDRCRTKYEKRRVREGFVGRGFCRDGRKRLSGMMLHFCRDFENRFSTAKLWNIVTAMRGACREFASGMESERT
jgi:hypothetical protein